jgi:hypothetical protein
VSKSTIFLLIFVIGATSIRGLAATECPDLESADSDALISYLAAVAPNQDNSRCVTFVIKHLDSARYEPAIPVLVRLLDFHRPPNEAEKAGVALHPRQSMSFIRRQMHWKRLEGRSASTKERCLGLDGHLQVRALEGHCQTPSGNPWPPPTPPSTTT